VDEFAWTVIGSAAGVVGAAAAVIFGLIPLLQTRREDIKGPHDPGTVEVPAIAIVAASQDTPVIVGQVPQEPVAFQSRAWLLADLDGLGPSGRVMIVRAVTGMRGSARRNWRQSTRGRD
jgi:hypothetical protein